MARTIKYIVSVALALVIPSVLVLVLSDADYTFSDPGKGMLTVSIKAHGQRLVECDEFAVLEAEAEKYRAQLEETKQAKMKLKKLGDCSRERYPIYVEIYIDGELVSGRYYQPSGWNKDGPSYIFKKYPVEPGVHSVDVLMRDSEELEFFNYTFNQEIRFKPGRLKVISFKDDAKELVLK